MEPGSAKLHVISPDAITVVVAGLAVDGKGQGAAAAKPEGASMPRTTLELVGLLADAPVRSTLPSHKPCPPARSPARRNPRPGQAGRPDSSQYPGQPRSPRRG